MKLTPVIITACLFAACNTASTTSEKTDSTGTANTSMESREERNKKVVMDSYSGMLKMDPSVMLTNISSDAVDYGDGSMKPIEGGDSIKAAIQSWLGNMDKISLDDTTMMASGDRVWVAGTFGGTYKEDAWGMPLKGKSFKLYDVDMFTLNDEGKITSHRSVQAPDAWYREVGVDMPKKK